MSAPEPTADATPLQRGLRMPAETAPHERTLMAWPRRAACWRTEMAAAKVEYAGVANAVAAFEPVTMACADEADAAEARAALTGACEVVVLPLDDSWLRDNGPCYVTDATTRVGVDFRFNAWGERFAPYDQDDALAARLVALTGDEVVRAPLVLEGGSIAVDGAGTVLTTEQCLLHPSRNPSLSREEIEAHLLAYLGAERVVWLGHGLLEDRDTDGHVDLVAAFTGPGRVLLQVLDEDDPNHEHTHENAERALAAGLEVVPFGLLPRVEVASEPVGASYLNLYACNGGVVVPVAGVGSDGEALARIAEAFEGREVVGVPGTTIAYGGGGPHCITQQVPALAL